MNTEYEFHMMQLADSLFPSGMFGMSGGLESFVKSGRIKNGNDLLRFVRQQLQFQIMPCDCAVFLAVVDSAKKGDIEKVVAADNKCYSIKLVKEVRIASARSGRQLLNCVMHIAQNQFAKKFHSNVDAEKSAGTYPACLAVAAVTFGIPEKSAMRMMLYSYCASMVGSAIRLGILEHFEGQGILTRLAPYIHSLRIHQKDINELWQLTPLTEILQMQHEREELRMFIT
jgi:urease accessory protein